MEEAQEAAASGGAAGCEQRIGTQLNPRLGARPAPEIKIQCAKRLARARSALDQVHLDSPAGTERSGGVASLSLELCRRASQQGPGVQWRTRCVASTRGGDLSGR